MERKHSAMKNIYKFSHGSKKASAIGLWKQHDVCLQTNELSFLKNNEISSSVLLSDKKVFITMKDKVIKIENANAHTIYLKFAEEAETKEWFHTLRQIKTCENICLLGSGYFSSVDLVKIEGKFFARKTIQKTLSSSAQNQFILAEKKALIELQHPFIVKIEFCYQTSTSFHFGLEFIHGGDLYNLMNRYTLSRNDIRLILAEVLIALSFIHSQGYLYRDLKPENILISEDGTIKLTDFGLSIKQPYSKEMCGTLQFMAPEMVMGISYSSAADYWSFGVLAFKLFWKRFPFDDKNKYKMQQKIQTDQGKFPADADPIEKDFVMRFLEKNATKRAGFLKDHPFWNGLDFEKVENKMYKHEIVPAKMDENNIVHMCEENFIRKYNGKHVPEEAIDVYSRLENFSYCSI
jgi:serine/threonine protein kinase